MVLTVPCYIALINPAAKQYATARQQELILHSEFQIKQALLIKDTQDSKKSTYNRQLIAKYEVPLLIAELSRIATDHGLQMEWLAPKKTLSYKDYAKLPIKLKLAGDYHKLAAFISHALALNRWISVRKINLYPVPKEKLLRMEAVLHLFQSKTDNAIPTNTLAIIPQFIYNYPRVKRDPFQPLKSVNLIRTVGIARVGVSKLISLNFHNAPIQRVLQELAKFIEINIVVSEGVHGNITLNLHQVPWKQALNLILTMHGLGKLEMGNVLLIAPIDELLKQHTGAHPYKLQSSLIQINYAKAIDIAKLIQDSNVANSLLTKNGTVGVDPRTNTLWVRDTPDNLHAINILISKIDIPVKQVQIEARIVSISKESILDLGINFGGTKSIHVQSDGDLAENLNMDFGVLAANPVSMGIALAKLGPGILLDLELSALENENKAKIIASPRLITINQQAAIIESGEEIPYQEITTSGATSTSFKKAVLSLKVTPQITHDNRLLMDLEINQDTPSGHIINGVPAIVTKAIRTKVLIDNKQTLVLGGIYKHDENNQVKRLPFLGTLPVVGALFRNKHHQVNNEELLIFITPRIISSKMR